MPAFKLLDFRKEMELRVKMKAIESGCYIVEAELKKENIDFSRYPFSIPAVKAFEKLRFHPKATFFIGENGSGKSTVLEAVAIACGFNAEGGSRNFSFSTSDTHSELYKYVRLIRGAIMPRDGYFLRAESFYNVATEIDRIDDYSGGLIDAYGGKSLHKLSHGEAFFSLFMNRFKGGGLYILDEPEAALSPTRQLAFLSRMHELVEHGSQFIIATHSPLIMAYPDAVIYEFGEGGIHPVSYEDTEQFAVYKTFFNDHKRFFYELRK